MLTFSLLRGVLTHISYNSAVFASTAAYTYPIMAVNAEYYSEACRYGGAPLVMSKIVSVTVVSRAKKSSCLIQTSCTHDVQDVLAG
jgi:hypothetical protein